MTARDVTAAGATPKPTGRADESVERVLVVAPEPFYEDRGTPIAVREVLNVLSEREISVDLLTYPIGEPVDLAGLRTFRIPNPFGIRSVPIGFSLRKLLLDAFMVLPLRRRLRTTRYSCIHAVEEATFLAAVLRRRDPIPLIYDMQSSLPEQLSLMPVFRGRFAQRMLRACERWLLRNVDLVVCSTGLADYVRRIEPQRPVCEWRYAGHDVEVFPEEVDLLRKQLRIGPTTRIVVYCGTFEGYQGLPTLVDSIPLVKRELPDTVFVLVGATGHTSRPLERALSRASVGNDVRVVPRQPREQIPKYLAMADVVVSPRHEGANLPLKIFDYMAAGKPIVAIDTPSHRSVLDDDCAILVDATPEALARGIVSVLRDPERAERIGKRARCLAHSGFGSTPFVDFVVDLHRRAETRDPRP